MRLCWCGMVTGALCFVFFVLGCCLSVYCGVMFVCECMYVNINVSMW